MPKVRINQGPGPGASVFTDNFAVLYGSLGPNWCYIGTRASICPPQFSISALRKVVAGQLQMNNFVGANINVEAGYVPLPLIDPSLSGKKQFSEVTFFSDTGAGNTWGPAVFQPIDMIDNGSGIGGNYFALCNAAAQTIICRNEVSGLNLFVLNPITFNAGDVFRLEIDPQPAQNNVTLFKNNAQIGTGVDNNANRAVVGFPGIYVRTLTSAQTTILTGYRGGRL